MAKTTAAPDPSDVEMLDALEDLPTGEQALPARYAGVEQPHPGGSARVGDGTKQLRLFCIRVLNYVTNHVVAHVPSFTLRRLWYQRALGIEFGPGASVFLGAYVWFFGPRDARRRGVSIGRNSFINRDCTIDIRTGLTIGD